MLIIVHHLILIMTKNYFLVLREGDGYESFGAPEKSLVLILAKQRQNFAWVFITMVIIVICLLKEKNLSLKQIMKMSMLSKKFCLRSISSIFDYIEAEEVSLKGNMCDFSVDYDAINKSDILNNG